MPIRIAGIRIKQLRDVRAPSYGSSSAAAFDFYLPRSTRVTIQPAAQMLVGSGLAMEVPSGYVLLLFARSGSALKHYVSLGNGVGVIDADYRGEVCGILRNDGDHPFIIEEGGRFMQGMLLPVPMVAFSVIGDNEELSSTARGAGGFGSTG